jgi:hypothetical protein
MPSFFFCIRRCSCQLFEPPSCLPVRKRHSLQEGLRKGLTPRYVCAMTHTNTSYMHIISNKPVNPESESDLNCSRLVLF